MSQDNPGKEPGLEALIGDTEAQLDAALATVAAGDMIDFSDLVPRLERICTQAVAERATALTPRLGLLIARLDSLGRLLRERIAALAGGDAPDPGRAAALYRAAAPPATPEPEDKG